jgi:hypothetical protein
MVWGGVSQHHRTELVVIASSFNAVCYREDILLPPPSCRLIQTWPSSHTACSVHDFLQDRNVRVLPWPVKSPDLNPIKHVWDLLDRKVRARAIPPNLQVPWWKSGVTSHSKNWQIWSSPWGGDALQYLMQLVATPDTDYFFWFGPPLCSGTHSISVSHMSVELV